MIFVHSKVLEPLLSSLLRAFRILVSGGSSDGISFSPVGGRSGLGGGRSIC